MEEGQNTRNVASIFDDCRRQGGLVSKRSDVFESKTFIGRNYEFDIHCVPKTCHPLATI